MNIRSEVRGAPRALRETLEKGRPEYDALVRRTRWGDGPLYILASGASYPAALSGSYAFERLLGWPAVAGRAANFLAYSSSLIRPKSIVLAVSLAGEADPTLEAALQARSRGATLLAMTASPTSPLAESADGVFLIRPEERDGAGLQAGLCLYAAMGFLTLVAARALKRHHQKLDELEREYEKLPDHSEWVLTRLTDAVPSLASRLQESGRLVLIGGGFYYPAALQAADTLDTLTPLRALARDAVEAQEAAGKAGWDNGAVLFLSGSRCRLKKEVHALAGRLSAAGGNLFAVTDSNDRELSGATSLSVLLPELAEMAGSAVALFFLQYLASHVSRMIEPSAKPLK
jgi:glutamine---fructose-6-phosphate transaminase (isomerizing)